MDVDLKQYKNTLSPKKIAEGMNAAISNSYRLSKDASIMFDAQRYPSTFSLAVLSLEEAGKLGILRSLAIAKNGDEVKTAWKRFRKHTDKNSLWIFPSMVMEGGKVLGDFKNIFLEKNNHTSLLENLKQISFYTDCLGDKNWSVPENIIERDLTEHIVNTAKLFAKPRKYTEKEIILWVKHMKPSWNTGEMNASLIKWYEEMISCGL